LANKPLVVFRLLFSFIFMIFVTHNGDVSPQSVLPFSLLMLHKKAFYVNVIVRHFESFLHSQVQLKTA